MNRLTSCLILSMVSAAFVSGQTISAAHPTIKPSPSVTLSVVAVTDEAHRQSWDLSGHRLNRCIYPSAHGEPAQLKPGFVNRYVIVETSEQGADFKNLATLKAMTTGRLPIFPNGSDANFTANGVSRQFAFEMTVPASQKKTDLILLFSNSPSKVYGEVTATKGKVKHKGFNFAPLLLSTNGGEMYSITLPANPMMDFHTDSKDANGKPTSISWLSDPKYPIKNGKPFGTGPSKYMRLLARPLRPFKVDNIPLLPR